MWAGALAVACCLGLGFGGGLFLAGGQPVGNEVSLLAAGCLWAGILVGLIQRHPRRALGQIPYGAVCITVALVGLALDLGSGWCLGLLFFGSALASAPLRFLTRDAASNAEGFRHVGLLFVMLACVGIGMKAVEHLAWPALPWLFAAAAGVGTVLAFWLLYGEFLEQTLEILLWPIYRMRGFGPGKQSFPLRGPVLVVSNHTAWLDPLWLGKVVPRRIIPMMGSGFYDLPVMRWLMVYIVGAIRVQDSAFRREVPELDEAIAALDRGECVVLFPEGRVRRKEEEALRPFGQGVWHILQRRPQTPVVVCWIEGGWGSFFSHRHGPPMKNKPFDFWRPIHIGISDPQVLDAAVLAEHRATRTALRTACLEARRFVGLEPHVLAAPPGKDQEEEDETP